LKVALYFIALVIGLGGAIFISALVIGVNETGEKEIKGKLDKYVFAIEKFKQEKGKCPSKLSTIGLADSIKVNGLGIPVSFSGGDSTDCTVEYFWASHVKRYKTKTKNWELEHY